MANTIIDNTIHTSALSGEALTIQEILSEWTITYKQTWEVTQTDDFKWQVKTALYVKDTNPYQGGTEYGEIFIDVVDGTTQTKYLWNGTANKTYFLSGTNGIMVNDVYIANANQMRNSFTKILEYTLDIDCLSPSEKTIYLTNGYGDKVHTYKKGWQEEDFGTPITVTIAPIYLTLPKFSGFRLKRSGSWKHCLIWKKINGVWKRCIPHKKINGSWERGV